MIITHTSLRTKSFEKFFLIESGQSAWKQAFHSSTASNNGGELKISFWSVTIGNEYIFEHLFRIRRTSIMRSKVTSYCVGSASSLLASVAKACNVFPLELMLFSWVHLVSCVRHLRAAVPEFVSLAIELTAFESYWITKVTSKNNNERTTWKIDHEPPAFSGMMYKAIERHTLASASRASYH